MKDNTKKMKKRTLKPYKHITKEMYIANDVKTEHIRDDIASMEHLIFSLSTQGKKEPIIYEHNNQKAIIKPSSKGFATIFDKDIWIYCISKLRQSIFEKKPISKYIKFTTYDFLVTTNRGLSGRDYSRVKEALERLSGTRIETNISTGNVIVEQETGLIDSWRIVKEDTTGKVISLEVTLSDWMFNSVITAEVLTINTVYFRIRKAIDRRVYEIARKHCGNQVEFPMGLGILHKKTGSTSSLKEFRRAIKNLALNNIKSEKRFNQIRKFKTDKIKQERYTRMFRKFEKIKDEDERFPDYQIIFDIKKDLVTFKNLDSNAEIKKQVAQMKMKEKHKRETTKNLVDQLVDKVKINK